MNSTTLSVLAFLVLFGIVLSAEMPQIVYIHYSTPEEAEEAQKKILAEYEGATIILGDDPTLTVANVTETTSSPTPETTTSEKLLETKDEEDHGTDAPTIATTTTTTSTTTTTTATEATKDDEKVSN